MKILLLGANGQVGWELQRALAPLATLVALSRKELDLHNLLAITQLIQTVKPTIVINAAAYTQVDKAECEVEIAYQINATAVQLLAQEVARCGGLLIHYSTDYVFDGNSKTPYLETDKAKPINVYGKSKLAGEQLIANSGCNYIILRTSWVYATRGSNFIKTILKLTLEREQLTIINDQIGAPTSAAFIADVTAHIVRQLCATKAINQAIKEIYHLTASGYTNWYDYAQLILTMAKEHGTRLTSRLIPINSANYNSAALRPNYSLLDSNKLCNTFNVQLPDWSLTVRRTVSELLVKD